MLLPVIIACLVAFITHMYQENGYLRDENKENKQRLREKEKEFQKYQDCQNSLSQAREFIKLSMDQRNTLADCQKEIKELRTNLDNTKEAHRKCISSSNPIQAFIAQMPEMTKLMVKCFNLPIKKVGRNHIGVTTSEYESMNSPECKHILQIYNNVIKQLKPEEKSLN